MKLEFHVHLHLGHETLALIQHLLEEGIKVAESPEMVAFRERVEAALANVIADINRLLENSTGLSDEDKATLENIATSLENAANIVPES